MRKPLIACTFFLLASLPTFSADNKPVPAETKPEAPKESPKEEALKLVRADMEVLVDAEGSIDASNVLKPALARGELRTIAATTWSEYKKYFEKDAALARRFQPVKVDEPSEAVAMTMLRGLRSKFEDAHQVIIQDEAVAAAVRLSARYISGRQLPDKAVDLLDTCAARVKIALQQKPAAVEDGEVLIRDLKRELEALARDKDADLGHRQLLRIKGEDLVGPEHFGQRGFGACDQRQSIGG